MQPLLKGKVLYNWPPCTYQLRSVAFDKANIIPFLQKLATLMRRSIVLCLPFQLVFPGQTRAYLTRALGNEEKG